MDIQLRLQYILSIQQDCIGKALLQHCPHKDSISNNAQFDFEF